MLTHVIATCGRAFSRAGRRVYAWFRVSARKLARAFTRFGWVRPRENDNDLLQAAADNMPVGLVMFNASKELIVANATFRDLYAIPAETAYKGANFRDVLERRFRDSGTDACAIAERVQAVVDLVDRQQPHTRIDVLEDGRRISVAHRPLPCGGWVGTHQDVTEREVAREQLQYMASHDTLTGLRNRAYFWSELKATIERENRGIGEYALHMVDLDLFKQVNDTHGHPAGDAVLQEVAERLKESVRTVDVVARLGGDEFAVLQSCQAMAEGDAERLAARIIEAVSRDIDVRSATTRVGASVGIAFIESCDRETIRRADTALYHAKASGGNCFRIYDSDTTWRAMPKSA
ncbi:MAG: diguanylate cyclase [Pseudomonadota bacterium]